MVVSLLFSTIKRENIKSETPNDLRLFRHSHRTLYSEELLALPNAYNTLHRQTTPCCVSFDIILSGWKEQLVYL